MKYLSLFSGIGGFDIAFTEVGMECAGMCEIDKSAQEVLSHNFPDVKIYNDVKEIGIGTHTKGSVDLICGGFPCQDLSIAGKRAGLAGERSGLWFEFARIIDELEPGWVVIENVPGLLSSDKGSDFAVIIQWLAERGYGVAWRVLDAQYFGVPQRRRRVFVVASLRDGRAAEVLFEREGMFGDIAKGGEEGETVASTFTIRTGKEGGGKGYLEASSPMTLGGQPQWLQTVSGKQVFPTLASSMAKKQWLGNQEAMSGDYFILAGDGMPHANLVKDGSPSLTKTHANHVLWEMQHASEAYRESQGGVVPTLQQRMGTGGNNVPLVGIRRLTPTECARLQGFPDDWNDWLSDSARYRQFGNAVAVPVVRWIASRIVND
jgi:DNA (cytosine-5)-methyltransferase 1